MTGHDVLTDARGRAGDVRGWTAGCRDRRRRSGERHPAEGRCADREAEDRSAAGHHRHRLPRQGTPNRFLLKDAAVEIKPWVAPTVHGAGPGSPKPSASQTVFALRNPQGLEQHVGHRIEVRGVVAPATANLPPTPDTIAAGGFTGVPQPTSPGPAAVPRLAPPTLDNKDLRMIAASCSQREKSTRAGRHARGVTCGVSRTHASGTPPVRRAGF